MDSMLIWFYSVFIFYILFNSAMFYLFLNKRATKKSWSVWQEYKSEFTNKSLKHAMYATLIATMTPLAYLALKDDEDGW